MRLADTRREPPAIAHRSKGKRAVPCRRGKGKEPQAGIRPPRGESDESRAVDVSNSVPCRFRSPSRTTARHRGTRLSGDEIQNCEVGLQIPAINMHALRIGADAVVELGHRDFLGALADVIADASKLCDNLLE